MAISNIVPTMSIGVKTSFVSFHCWKAAPNKVAFLRNLHRHVFHICVEVSVQHVERELEFFSLKEEIDKEMQDFLTAHDTSSFSCESFASHIFVWLSSSYPDRRYSVTVQEDDENYAKLSTF